MNSWQRMGRLLAITFILLVWVWAAEAQMNPAISIYPPKINFSGYQSEMTFWVKNTGDGILSVSSFSFAGGNASAYSLSANSLDISEGDSASVTVTFIDSGIFGDKSDVLILENNTSTNPESLPILNPDYSITYFGNSQTQIDGLAFNSSNDLIVMKDNQLLRLSKTGAITVIVGTEASFSRPQGAFDGRGLGLTVDNADQIYVADTGNNRIRKVDTEGNVTTLAGSAQGYADGNGASALFDEPWDVVIDATGNLYVADYGNNRIRKIDTSNNVTSIAGYAGVGQWYQEGPAEIAVLRPRALAIDSNGNLFIANHTYSSGSYHDNIGNTVNEGAVKKLDTDGFVVTIKGAALHVRGGFFNYPWAIASDHDNNLYVLDQTYRLRKVSTVLPPSISVSVVVLETQ